MYDSREGYNYYVYAFDSLMPLPNSQIGLYLRKMLYIVRHIKPTPISIDKEEYMVDWLYNKKLVDYKETKKVPQ